jgi:integrase/recombinase XerD
LGEIEVEKIGVEHIRAFYISLRKKGLSESSIATYHRTIKSYYSWAEETLEVARVDKKIPKPKAANREVYPFSEDEIRRIVNYCTVKNYRKHLALRNKLLVLLLLDTGIRIGECCRLKIEDLNLSTGEITIKPFGKGIKSAERHVFIGKQCKNLAWKYLATRQESDKKAALFVTHYGKALTPNAAKHLLANIGKECEVEHLHAHRFRHTFAIQFLRNKGDVFTLQYMLGHRDISMTKVYVQLANLDIMNAHRLASPVDNWKL